MHHIPLNSLQQELESLNFSFILSQNPQALPISLSKRSFNILSSSLSSPKTPLPQIYCIALIYLLSNEISNDNNPEIASILYLLLDKLQGSLLTPRIRSLLTGFLKAQTSNPGFIETLEALDESVLGVSKALLLNNPDLDVNPIENNLKKPQNIIEFLDFLCTAHSLEEQALLMVKYASGVFETLLNPSLKASNGFFNDRNLQKGVVNQKELFLALHKFLDTAVLQTKYSILIPEELLTQEKSIIYEISTKTPIKNDDFTRVSTKGILILSFQDLETKVLLRRNPVYKEIEPILDYLLKNLVLSREGVSQEMKLEFIKFLLSIILERLWDSYIIYQPGLKLRLQAIFNELDRENLHICQLQAGFLLYEKLWPNNSIKRVKNTKEFSPLEGNIQGHLERNMLLKELLQENPLIKNCVDSFQKDNHLYYKGPGILNELILKENCPLSEEILPGDSFTRIFEVFTPNSIIYWVFATKTLDIEFQIEFLGSFDSNSEDSNVLYPKKRLETGKKVQRGLIWVKRPGLYRLQWDNSYSWFTGKNLRYRVFILEIEEGFPLKTSPFTVFNTCRGDLGLEINNEARKKVIKGSLGDLFQWKGENRIVIWVKGDRNVEIKAQTKEKSFELIREFDENRLEEGLQGAFMEVLNRLGDLGVISEVCMVDGDFLERKVDLGVDLTVLSYRKVFLWSLVRRFGEIRGDLRKNMGYSKVLVVSLVDFQVNIVLFSDLDKNLTDLCDKKVENEGFIGLLVDILIILRFRPHKVIINRKGLLKEGFEKEEFRMEVIKRLEFLMKAEKRDIEGLFDKIGIDFELFDYDFKLESILN